jgi:hypothetical protein
MMGEVSNVSTVIGSVIPVYPVTCRSFRSVGEDHFLGKSWARQGFALRELLNGETGRLDCGTLDAILCDNLSEQGFDPNAKSHRSNSK